MRIEGVNLVRILHPARILHIGKGDIFEITYVTRKKGRGVFLQNTRILHYICSTNIKKDKRMSQATISIRVDQSLKQNFDILCEDFGISTTAAFNIFMKTVVR